MQKPRVGFLSLRLLFAGILTAFSSGSMAAGFALIEQSASQMGNAFAGGSAVANDASTIFFNPAGLTRVPHQLILAGHIVRTSAEFSGSATDLLGNPVARGGDGGDAGTTALVPNLYYALPLDRGFVFGLGVNVPFGLSTEYNDGWVGRYHAVKSEVTTVNINPSLAYKVNDDFSVGFGLNAQYIDAELTQNIDQGSLCIPTYLRLGFDLPTAAATCAGLTPQGNDAFAKVEGDDWSAGFNLGLLFQPTSSTRLGLAYRSKIEHSLNCCGKFKNTVPQFSNIGFFVKSDAEADVDVPQTASLSIYQDINTQWSVMADATWTGWSSFKELRIEYQDSNQPDSVTDQSWNDSMRYAIGVDYRHNSNWTFRGGLAFDESPIPNDKKRTPRIPGEDRTWVALGFGYKASDAITIDVGYAHLFVEDPKLRSGSPTAGVLDGEYDAEVDLLSAQVVWNI
ncbi:OmpP1/FadL family transporter [Thiogranum longum]